MPTLQVFILVVDQPHNPDSVGLKLDAIAIENQSTSKSVVEIHDAYAIDYFHKSPRKELRGGRPRWRWADSASSKIEDDASYYKAVDSLVFDVASYTENTPTTHIAYWADRRIVDLRQTIDNMIKVIDKPIASFNKDPKHTFRVQFLGVKDFDETIKSRFVIVRKWLFIGPIGVVKTPVWTERYW